MTNQNNTAQPVLTDDQIEVLAKKHIAPHADRLDKLLPHRAPYRQTEQFRRVKALITDVLSRLRAPAPQPEWIDDPHDIEQGMMRNPKYVAPVADERAAFEEAYLKITMGKRGGLGRDADGQYGHLMTRALWRGWKARAALASAPVADDAQERRFGLASELRQLARVQDELYPNFRLVLNEAALVLEGVRPALVPSWMARPAHRAPDYPGENVAATKAELNRIFSERIPTGAPVAGEAQPTEAELKRFARSMPARPWGIGSRQCDALAFARALLSRYAAPQANTVAGVAQQNLAPPECPITRRPFFMTMEHPELGWVPTYGGPYDSYTIPYMDGEANQRWHERELLVHRYDHDLGGWRMDAVEVIPLRIIHEDVLNELQDAAPQASADAFDFAAHLARQAEFSARTFGPGARVAGICDHIRKELIEVETSGGDMKEWVDVIILGLDGAWRSGATPQEIIAAIVAKQVKNEARTWPDWRTVDPNKAIEHDRGGQP